MLLHHYLSAIARFGHMYTAGHLKELHLTGSQAYAILHLHHQKQCNQNDLSDFLMVDKSTVTKTMAKLEEKGYICRHTNTQNRRENIITLTELGEAMVQKINTVSTTWTSLLLQDLSPEEKQMVTRLCAQAADSAKTLAQQTHQNAKIR